jgi:phosphatidylglycerol:prolipoprotein diacylglycerol transferase
MGWPIRWYGIMYLVGIWLAWVYGRTIILRFFPHFKRSDIDDFVPWAVLGIIIGGRLGYVLFYDLDHSFASPLTIFQTWRGGMAFHGGLIGVGFAMIWYTQKKKINLVRFADLISCCVPIGIFCGRIGNFVNQEVYGRVSEMPWAVISPALDDLPRHPSQLYEAFLEGIFLWGVLRLLLPFLSSYRGALTGSFLIGYAVIRSFCEMFRVPDNFYTLVGDYIITQGQLLSLPMLFAGLSLLFLSLRKS